MNKKSAIVVALLVLLFIVGFFSGIYLRQQTHDKNFADFKSRVSGLEKRLVKSEFLNKKIKVIFQTVEEKNLEISEKNQIIRAKEEEINDLSRRIATANPGQLKSLAEQLNKKTTELRQLREDYDTVKDELDVAQQDLAEANKILREQNEKIDKLNKDLASRGSKSKEEITEEIEEVKQQINAYESGSMFEFKADNYAGKKKRRRKDQHYYSAYYHYALAGAVYDMKRVYDKIRSSEIRNNIDNGVLNPNEAANVETEENGL